MCESMTKKKDYSLMTDEQIKEGFKKYSKRMKKDLPKLFTGSLFVTLCSILPISYNHPRIPEAHREFSKTLYHLNQEREEISSQSPLSFESFYFPKEAQEYFVYIGEARKEKESKLIQAIKSVETKIDSIEQTSEFAQYSEEAKNRDSWYKVLFGLGAIGLVGTTGFLLNAGIKKDKFLYESRKRMLAKK